MKIGIIGLGVRMRYLVKLLLETNKEIEIGGIYDIDKSSINKFRESFGEIKIYESYQDLIENIDWIFIGSINSAHAEQIISALNGEKNIFCEKPIAMNFNDLKEIKKSFEATNKLFLVSYPLRYSPHYRKIKQIVDSGKIGKIISLEFNEILKLSHGAFIMTDWRRLEENSGGHLLEKCCHDFDVVNWIVGSLPRKVSSFGGLNFFTSENSNLFNDNGEFMEEKQENPFLSEKDIVDNQVAILEYKNGVRATFHTNCSSGIPERRIYICGTKGTLRADLITGKIEIRSFDLNEEIEEIIDEENKGGHGGGDKYLVDDLKMAMEIGKVPEASVLDAITSAIVCLAIEKSRKKSEVVDLDSTWKELGCA